MNSVPPSKTAVWKFLYVLVTETLETHIPETGLEVLLQNLHEVIFHKTGFSLPGTNSQLEHD